MDGEFQLTSHTIAQTRREEQKLWSGRRNSGELELWGKIVGGLTFLDRKFQKLAEAETLLEKEKVERIPSAPTPQTPPTP